MSEVFSGELEKKGTGMFDGWSLRHFVLVTGPAQGSILNPILKYYVPRSSPTAELELKGEIHLWHHTRCIKGEDALFELHGCKGSKRAGTDDVVKLRACDVHHRTEWIEAIETGLAAYKSVKNFTGATMVRDFAYANNLVDHRRYHLVRYDDCLIASELVDALVQKGVASSRDAAVDMCDELVRYDTLHHVCDDHPFEDGSNFYRFSMDDDIQEQHSRQSVPAPFHHSRELPGTLHYHTLLYHTATSHGV